MTKRLVRLMQFTLLGCILFILLYEAALLIGVMSPLVAIVCQGLAIMIAVTAHYLSMDRRTRPSHDDSNKHGHDG